MATARDRPYEIMKTLHTSNAPQAIGSYSQGIVANGFIFCSGQIGLDPQGNLVEGLEKQTHQALKNIEAILQKADRDLDHVVKTTIFITDINNFTTVNNIYGKYFSRHKPARSTVEVSSLPKNALIEIEAIALIQ